MSLSNSRTPERNLRLVHASPQPVRPSSRAALALRAAVARVEAQLHGLVALAGAAVALAPLLLRRGPNGRRAQVPRRIARVIVLQQRRRASPP